MAYSSGISHICRAELLMGFFFGSFVEGCLYERNKMEKKEQFKQCPNTSTAALKNINGMLGLIERKYTKYDVNATRKRLEQRAWRIFTEDIKQIELLPSFWSYSTGVVCYMFTTDAIMDGTLVYLIHIHHVFFPTFHYNVVSAKRFNQNYVSSISKNWWILLQNCQWHTYCLTSTLCIW